MEDALSMKRLNNVNLVPINELGKTPLNVCNGAAVDDVELDMPLQCRHLLAKAWHVKKPWQRCPE